MKCLFRKTHCKALLYKKTAIFTRHSSGNTLFQQSGGVVSTFSIVALQQEGSGFSWCTFVPAQVSFLTYGNAQFTDMDGQPVFLPPADGDFSINC